MTLKYPSTKAVHLSFAVVTFMLAIVVFYLLQVVIYLIQILMYSCDYCFVLKSLQLCSRHPLIPDHS